MINTGTYILEPKVLNEIQPGEFVHITDLTERCIQKEVQVGVFPASEKSWLDIGQIEGMKRMIQELDPESLEENGTGQLLFP